VAGGCQSLEYEGFQNPLLVQLYQDIPIIYLAVEDGPPLPAAVDTSSPLVVIDSRVTVNADGTLAVANTPLSGQGKDHDLRLMEGVECLLDCHCTDSTRPLCNSGSGRCEARQCQQDSDCTTTARPRCHAASGRCLTAIPECSSDSDCAEPARPDCSAGICTAPQQTCDADRADSKKSRCEGSTCIYFNPRFLFKSQKVFDLQAGEVGLDSKIRLGGLLGAPLLREFAVRLTYGSRRELTLLDQNPDSLEDLADDCDHSKLSSTEGARTQRCTAAVATTLAGGGLVELSGQRLKDASDPSAGTESITTSITMPASRVLLPACLQPATFDRDKDTGHGAETASGTPVTALLATGLGTSVISRNAFSRLCETDAAFAAKTPQCDLSSATEDSVIYLPYGQEKVFSVTLDRLAVVTDETRTFGPCGELALRRRLLIAGRAGLPEEDKKLLQDKQVNGAGVALVSAPVTLAVMRDTSRLLQGYNLELRPAVSDVDLVLGGSFLRSFGLEVDYPAGRTLFRCDTAQTLDTCEVLPWCAHPSRSDRQEIRCPTPKN
jgi:hypothetical protein